MTTTTTVENGTEIRPLTYQQLIEKVSHREIRGRGNLTGRSIRRVESLV